MASHDVPIHQQHEERTESIYDTPGMLPSRYVYVLTNLCNLSCPFCFQHRKKTSNPMSKEDWIDLTLQLPKYARVTLTGGEPLVYKGFTEILDVITKQHDCNIISNGILLNEERIENLLSYERLKVFSISIDDIGNKTRNLKPEQWHHLTAVIRHFIKRRNESGAKLLLDIKTIVLDENAADLFEIYRFCMEELQCDTHAFQFLKGSHLQHADTMSDFAEILNPPRPHVYTKLDEIHAQLEKVRLYANHHDKRSYLHPVAGDLQAATPLPDLNYINDPEFRPGNYLPCKFPWSSVHINADGYLFPCLSVAMGNIKQQPLQDIIFGEKFEHFRKSIRENGTVPSCHRCGWLKPRAELLEPKTLKTSAL